MLPKTADKQTRNAQPKNDETLLACTLSIKSKADSGWQTRASGILHGRARFLFGDHVFSMAAAAAAAAGESCDICGRNLADMPPHGQSVHRGLCLKKRLRARPISATPPNFPPVPVQSMEPPEEPSEEELNEAEELDAGAADPISELSEGDAALLRLFFDRSDLKVSLLERIVALVRMPNLAISFTSAKQLLDFVDALPGPEFRQDILQLQDVAGLTLPLWHRSIVDVTLVLVRRFNGAFIDPLALPLASEGTSDFTDGTRFRELTAELTRIAGPDAVLMPLVLSSGMRRRTRVSFDSVLDIFPSPSLDRSLL